MAAPARASGRSKHLPAGKSLKNRALAENACRPAQGPAEIKSKTTAHTSWQRLQARTAVANIPVGPKPKTTETPAARKRASNNSANNLTTPSRKERSKPTSLRNQSRNERARADRGHLPTKTRTRTENKQGDKTDIVRTKPRWWCPGPESNRHALRRGILSPLRLPISPPGHAFFDLPATIREF